jgi:hypothetical protein
VADGEGEREERGKVRRREKYESRKAGVAFAILYS